MAPKTFRVLLVEDNPGDARLIQESLREAPGAIFEVHHADRLDSALETLAAGDIDVVLLDLGLPDANGLDTLVRAHDAASGVPIVVLTGLDDEELAMRAVQEGAQDYLIKGLADGPFVRAVRYAIERKLIEEELRTTVDELERRTAELESFTYSVSHDLKEPLRTLEAFSQFLLEDYSSVLDEQGRDYLTRMGKAAGRMKQMIEELLMLSRLSRRPQEMERVSVSAVVSNVIAAIHATVEQRNGRIEIAGDLPDVGGDVARVEEIFGNLIGNGLKFNQDCRPTVEIGMCEPRDNQAVFFVRDNGIGIEADYHAQIFGVFQRLHRREDYEGTGAGLAIVKRAAEAMGGSVWLESTPGQGSTFFVAMPLWEDVPVAEYAHA